MKTFIYFSQGEWRTFQAEELPIKPRVKDYVDMSLDLPSNAFYNDMNEYESEIAALKAKSLKVGNPEICPQNVPAVEDGKIYKWPGTISRKKKAVVTSAGAATYEITAILKLPETS